MPRPHLRRAAALAGALALAGASSAAPAQPAASPPAPDPTGAPLVQLPLEHFTLPNGLRVVLHEDHRAPVVTVRVMYDVGVKDDPEGQPGMAAVVTRLIEEPSTRHVARDQRDTILKTVGVAPWEVEATTHLDYTTLHVTVPRRALELALWLESDRMGFALDGVDQAAVDAEHAEVAGAPGAPATYDRVLAALYGAGHPYGPRRAPEVPLKAREVRARIRSHYGPSNAALVLAGDFSAAEARALVARLFGPLASAPRPQALDPAAHPPRGAERQLRAQGDVAGTTAVLAWPTAAYLTPEDVALDGVARVLARRLHRRLVEEAKIATEAGARQSSFEMGSAFRAWALLAPGKSPEEAQRLIAEEIGRLQQAEADPAEVRYARLLLLQDAAADCDGLEERSGRLASYMLRFGRPDHLDSYLQGYHALSAATLRRAAQQALPLDRSLAAVITPAPEQPGSHAPEET